MKITVCIATKNRSIHLSECIRSILKNAYKNFEINIIDQSTNLDTKAAVASFQNPRIHHIKTNTTGKSIALNIGILQSKGDICVFTDDDCIVSPYWLQSIFNYYKKHTDVSMVFGQTLPYKSKDHPLFRCPALFQNKTPRIVSNPYIDHFIHLGNGNNMSIKRNVFFQVGSFQQWLGPGSISNYGGEEGELLYRMLKNKMKAAFNPKTIVYHNKWLTDLQFNKLTILYDVGTIAWYTYWCIKNKDYTLWNKIKSRKTIFKNRIKSITYYMLHPNNAFFINIYYMYLEFISLLRGVTIGFFVTIFYK